MFTKRTCYACGTTKKLQKTYLIPLETGGNKSKDNIISHELPPLIQYRKWHYPTSLSVFELKHTQDRVLETSNNGLVGRYASSRGLLVSGRYGSERGSPGLYQRATEW